MFQKPVQFSKKNFSFFGAAMFLRPSQPNKRLEAINYPLKMLLDLARQNPSEWEHLLMKRNYADYAWDNIGGNNEKDEFPLQTMKREVKEEVGWLIKEQTEICRQWEKGILKGFVYAVIPSEINFMEDNPPRVPCDEVQKVEYFNLLHILQSDMFKANVKGRVKAFIEGESDFSLL